MYESKHDPWPFIVLLVLILLLIAAGLYLAARLVVAPQPGTMVEVTPSPTSTQPPEDEIQFFPWNAHTPEEVGGFIRPDHEAEYRAWHKENLVTVPEILGFSGMEDSADREQAGYYLGFWTDCPVTAQNGQPALLDVAFGRDDVNFGMTWVAHSVGDLPTQAQREAAVAQVTEDIHQEFLGSVEETPIGALLWDVEVYLCNTFHADEVLSFAHSGKEQLGDVLYLMRDLYRSLAGIQDPPIQDPEQAIHNAAQELDMTIQLATTQRQVVAIFTYDPPDPKIRTTVAVYYDMVLGQYSGVVINAIEDMGK